MLLKSLLISIIFLLGAFFFSPLYVPGFLTNQPSTQQDTSALSPGAKALIKSAYKDIDSASQLRDYHTHIVGTGEGNSGTFVNPKMTSWLHPIDHLKFNIYAKAAGVKDISKADSQYKERLKQLAQNLPVKSKFVLLAFDKHYKADGTADLEKTEFYVPNEYVYELSKQHPEIYTPCISIHPYRKDALQELEKYAKLGVKQIKWLPNAMGMDPSSPKCDSFYSIMKAYDMVLLSHAGHEAAVHAEEYQKFGNPLLLRKPLDMGVKVIIAHCASLGENPDLDDPKQPEVSNFKLFERLMSEKKYEGLLFGDISAITQFNRSGEALKTILQKKEWHHRLVNGSDYPLPAIDIIIRTGQLANACYITKEEAVNLDEIFKYNPLLFDFVLKRTLNDPDNKGNKLPASVFKKNNVLGY